MMEKTDETIPSREELAVFIEEAAVSVTNNYLSSTYKCNFLGADNKQ